jgi:small subunit ribosomal protein S20
MVKAKSSADAGEELAYQKTMLAISSIDKAVSKGIIHRNKGSRLKSRLMEKLNKK